MLRILLSTQYACGYYAETDGALAPEGSLLSSRWIGGGVSADPWHIVSALIGTELV